MAADIYTRKRLDQLETADVRPVTFEEPDAKENLQVEEIPGKLTEEIKKATGTAADPDLAKQLYSEAEALFRQASQESDSQRARTYLQAAAKYETAAKKWPDSALHEDALFMVGESRFFADEYPEANKAFEQLLKQYPHSRHLDRAEARRFSIAQYWLKVQQERQLATLNFNVTDKTRPLNDTFGNALRVFDRIRLDDPTGKLADDATLAAGNAHFAAGNFIQADTFFSDLRKAYPNSEHQFVAHLLSVKAKLESYQGPEYSGDPLDQAEELIKQIRTQFPVESQKEREYLARAYAEVRYLQAEREWWMARYFDRRSEYLAARIHYETLVKDFPETPYLARARERLQDLSGMPDRPPERLSWLINLFPRDQKVQPLLDAGDGSTIRR
jgi:outer membrane protein assembly factor BamD (BamD/ComL family)